MQDTIIEKQSAIDSVVRIKVNSHSILADTYTPVSLYLSLRDQYPGAALLESTDFRSLENCHSFIGLSPLAAIKIEQGQLEISKPKQAIFNNSLAQEGKVTDILQRFMQSFQLQNPIKGLNGLLGHCNFDAVQYFDNLAPNTQQCNFTMPDIHYRLYRFIIAFDHFRDEIQIIENQLIGEESQLPQLLVAMQRRQQATFPFALQGEESSNLSDNEFEKMVTLGKHHCQVGDVFQIVFSRQFSQGFKGDEFNVYRSLRSVNPSPYLFYFDFGTYKIMGSSPEAQLVIQNNIAAINPIAGTYKRTGDDEADRLAAEALTRDPKENAEHIMLVDLARNDLSRHARQVQVAKLKEIQFYSHVIHLVSKVEGHLSPEVNPLEVFADTFPAGTLSGAPKYKAIQLIHQYENQNRNFYGGAIGYLGFDGSINHAILIRSFLSKDNRLYCQAGAGIVAASEEAKELQEVNNKLGALKKALLRAQTI